MYLYFRNKNDRDGQWKEKKTVPSCNLTSIHKHIVNKNLFLILQNVFLSDKYDRDGQERKKNSP